MRLPLLSSIAASVLLITHALAQTAVPSHPSARLFLTIDESSTITLSGNVHPLAANALAAGASTSAEDSTSMEHMILHLKSDANQESQLATLVAQQNDRTSPLYHHYLTPQDFGSQFGVAAADIAKVASWLENNGFTIEQIPAGNRSIIFSGTVGQVTVAFKTQIHRLMVDGQKHIANVSDPQIPAAFSGVVGGIVQLHDFQAGHKITKLTPLPAATLAHPNYTAATGHFVSPADFSSIYDLSSLYSSGIDGTGQSIAIVARADIQLADIDTFRSTFGLAPNDPQILFVTNDPGMQAGGNSMEATLDAEWAGAVAPKATIKMVVGQCTNSGDGITAAESYAVNNNVAPIISVSYGLCESAMGASYLAYMNSLWQQAAAQGQSVFVSSGDTGAAGCNSQADAAATVTGINGLCSSPYATCVGGTEFAEGSNPAQYWLPGNSLSGGSVIGYIPETAWNESGDNGGSGLIATGGGVSTYFSKPIWQTGAGVPADGHRDVPDVSLTAAAHDGYAVYEYEYGMTFGGGTSFSTPSFAGIMALVNQKAGARQGLANPVLYALAAKQNSGGAAVFHDITTGNNTVPGVTGFSAATGYDLATGLGSVNGAVLVNHWADGITSLSLSASSGILTLNAGQSTKLTITVISGLNSVVTLAASNLPAGVTATFPSATIASPGSGTVTLTLAASATTKSGSYTITFTGTSAEQSASLNIPIVIAAPTFTVALSKTSVIANLPSSTPISITTSAQTGFSSALTLSISGAPTGVTATLSAKSVVAPGSGSVTLTIAATATATPSTSQLTLTVTGGGQTQTINISLCIPSFTVTAPSGYYKAIAGGTVTYPVTITPQAGFGSSITLHPRANYLPSGITTSFSSPTMSGAAASTSNVTMSVAKTQANGAYPFFIDGTGGNITQGAYEWLLVGIQGSCSIAVYNSTWSTNIMSVTAGQSVTGLAVCLWPQGTFSAPLTASFSGVPAGMTLQLAGPLKGDGNAVNLVISTTQSLMPATYPLTINTVTSDGYAQTYPFSVIVAGDSFSLAGAQSALTLGQGTTATFSATSTHNGIFNSAVTLAWSGLPPGVTAALAKSSFAAPGDGTTVTTFTTAATATPGSYTATLTATGGGVNRTWPVAVTVAAPSCTFAAAANTLALPAGKLGTVALSCGSLIGKFAAPISLTVTGTPSGTTATVSPTITAGGSASLSITTPLSMAATNYNLSVTATSGSFKATIPVAVSISASNFSMTGAQSTLSLTAGKTATASATLTVTGAFSSAVTLAWSGLPSGVTAALSKATLAAPGNGSVTTTFTASASTTAGTYNATLTATGCGDTQTIPLSITVLVNNFNLTTAQSALTIKQANSGQVSATTIHLGSFNSSIGLAWSGLPAGVTLGVAPSAMLSPGDGTTTTTFGVSSGAKAGVYTVTLTASGGGVTQAIPVTLTIASR